MDVRNVRPWLASLLLVFSMPVLAQQGTETVEPLTVTVGVNHSPPTEYWTPAIKVACT